MYLSRRIILKRLLLNTTIKLAIYIGIFTILNIFFSNFLYLTVLFTLLFSIIFNNKIHSFFNNIISQKIYPFISTAEKTLTDFNDKINSITDYQKLVNEFYALFDKIFSEHTWAFYILEKDTFLLKKFKSARSHKNIPPEIELKKSGNAELYYDLNENQISSFLNNNSDINSLLADNMDLLIPITGKNQVIALLFTNKENVQIFEDSTLKQLAKRVLQKSGNFLENSALYMDSLSRNLEIKKLFEVSEKLLASFDTNEILDFILKSLNEVIPYDAAAIFLLDDDEINLIPKASAGYGANTSELELKIGQGACGWVARNKKMSLLDNVYEAENYYPLRKETYSQISLPLLIHDKVLGVICLEKNEIAYFTSNFIDLFNMFANQAAIALYNAKQYEILLAKQSLEHELIIAGNVQQVLLPKRAPNYDKLDISFINKPCKIVGGDLYDIIPMDKESLGIMIGDIAGKGAGAAIMMSLLLAGFRSYKKTQFTVCEIVARLNNLLEESLKATRYATFFYGILSLKHNYITYTNAGHNSPLIVRKDGSVKKLYGGGIVLGYLANETYIQEEIPFRPGDLLVLYTDGITEAMNKKSQEFGEDRLLNVIKENFSSNSYNIREKIIDAVRIFTGEKEAEDDATLIIIKYS